MGKASTNKKVARAAGTGGGRTRGRTPWSYYGIIFLVVVLGVVGTYTSRQHRLSQINAAGSTAPPTVGSTSSAAYAVDVCGTILPNIATPKKNPVGITTQGDGIIHMSPTKASAAGKNATLGLFASSIGMKLNAAELQVPGGKLYTDGKSCEGKPGHVYVQRFSYPLDKTGVLETTLVSKIHLDNGAMYTIAFLPSTKKNSIPTPPAAVISKLQSLQAAATSTTATTTAGSGLSGTTATTVAGGTATTVAGGTATTAGSTTATTAGSTTATTAGSTATTAKPAAASTTTKPAASTTTGSP